MAEEIALDLELWPKQLKAFTSAATEILFGGASEGGKSHLVRVVLISACLAVAGIQCRLIRKKFKDILTNHLEGVTGFRAMLAPLVDKKLVEITQEAIRFYNGSMIHFVHCFTGDTLIQTPYGNKTIESLLGSSGFLQVTKSFTCSYNNVRLTRKSASVICVRFDDGSAYRCTPDHRFLTERGFVQAKDLLGISCVTNESQLSMQQLKSLKEKSTVKPRSILGVQGLGFIVQFGSITLEQFLKATRFIIKMRIVRITRLRIWNYLRYQHTENYTPALKGISSKLEKLLLQRLKRLNSGIARQKAMSGISSKCLELESICLIKLAKLAGQLIKALASTEHAAENVGGDCIAWKRKCVSIQDAGVEDVYCLTVPDIGLFPLSNGVLVSNCQDERQWTTAQGNESQIVIVDEATQISQRLIGYFRAWCRMPVDMKEKLPPEWRDKLPLIIYTANPVGPSVPYFRREFVKARPEGAIELIYGFKRQYILSRAEDNLSIDLESHKARLDGLNDPALAKALDVGDWDAPVGEFFPEYDESIHVVPDFTPPAHYFKYRSFDWGSAEPFSVGWWCVSDGEEFESDGVRMWFPLGSIIMYREWYGCNPEKPEDGIGMRNEDIARGIVALTPEMTSNITLTDSLPFQDRGGPSIADVFFENGVPLTRADTSRVTGWKHVRDRLKGREGYPLIYFCASCKYARDYLPALPRNPNNREDAAESGEATHNGDMIRYASAARPLVKTAPPPVEYTVKPVVMTFGEAIDKHQAKKRAGSSRY